MGVKVLEVPGITVVLPGTVYFKSNGILGVRVCWCAGGGCTGVERLESSDCDSSLTSQVVEPDKIVGLLNGVGGCDCIWLLFRSACSLAEISR